MNLQYLKESRLNKFKNQRLASESIGVSYEMYKSIESGRRVCSLGVLIEMCKVLNMDANKLLNLE